MADSQYTLVFCSLAVPMDSHLALTTQAPILVISKIKQIFVAVWKKSLILWWSSGKNLFSLLPWLISGIHWKQGWMTEPYALSQYCICYTSLVSSLLSNLYSPDVSVLKSPALIDTDSSGITWSDWRVLGMLKQSACWIIAVETPGWATNVCTNVCNLQWSLCHA